MVDKITNSLINLENKTSKNSANVKNSIVKAGNYRSEYLDWLADEEGDIDTVSSENSRFVDAHMQFDLTVKYEINDNFTLKAEAINLGNRPEFYYWGNPNQLSQYDIYGKSYSIGFNYKL